VLVTELERYSERLSDREIEVVVGNTAVIPCTAVTRAVPAAFTQFEFNSIRLRMTGKKAPRFQRVICGLYGGTLQ